MKEATFKLLAMAKKDAFSITKTVTFGRRTAFDKVAELWNDAGKLVSASQIASWYSNKPKENKSGLTG